MWKLRDLRLPLRRTENQVPALSPEFSLWLKLRAWKVDPAILACHPLGTTIRARGFFDLAHRTT